MKSVGAEASPEYGVIAVSVLCGSPLLLEGIVGLLEEDPDLKVVGSATDSRSAIAAVRQEQPDVVLLDATLPGAHLNDLIRRLRSTAPSARLVVLSAFAESEPLDRLLELGANGYVTHSTRKDELAAVIRAVARDKERIVFSVSRASLNSIGDTKSILSSREVEVLSLVAEGLTSGKIASTLAIAEGTVKRHLTNIYSKLDVASRIQAINKAASMGLIGGPARGR